MTRPLFTTSTAMTRRWGLGISGLTLAAAILTAALPAQQPATPPAQPAQATAAQQPAAGPGGLGTDVNAPTIRVGVNEVNLIFTVAARPGNTSPTFSRATLLFSTARRRRPT